MDTIRLFVKWCTGEIELTADVPGDEAEDILTAIVLALSACGMLVTGVVEHGDNTSD